MLDVKSWIKKCEGIKLTPYTDTAGKTTIGYGRNLTDDGITKDEADYLFDNDFNRCESELSAYPWFSNNPQNVRDALINMNFNLGITRLLQFKDMIAALMNHDFNKASIAALNSEWAIEVGERAKDVALMMRQQ
jgi:lysozyme